MYSIKRSTALLSALVTSVVAVYAQGGGPGQAHQPDVLICTDGERFVGQVVSATDSAVSFKSDVAGQLSIDWSKVQEITSSAKFAVIPKGVRLKGKGDEGKVPQGTISVADQHVQVNTGTPTPQTVPVTNVAQMVDEAAFQRAFQRQSFLHGWSGGASVGIAYTSSTQTSQSYTAGLNLTRAVPGETWVDQRSRTILGFDDEYGEISQPATPTTKTSVAHLGIEQDWYFHPRLFGFVQGILDHNYSQGLDLQQDYGGGLGFVVAKSAKQEFDVKASVDYIDQRFTVASQNKSLIGSTFGETYVYKFPHAILFSETGNYIPAWNNTNAFSSMVNANLTFPVYHRFGFTVGGIDNYLNDPPPGFKKNSFTLTMGATYSIQ